MPESESTHGLVIVLMATKWWPLVVVLSKTAWPSGREAGNTGSVMSMLREEEASKHPRQITSLQKE